MKTQIAPLKSLPACRWTWLDLQKKWPRCWGLAVVLSIGVARVSADSAAANGQSTNTHELGPSFAAKKGTPVVPAKSGKPAEGAESVVAFSGAVMDALDAKQKLAVGDTVMYMVCVMMVMPFTFEEVNCMFYVPVVL